MQKTLLSLGALALLLSGCGEDAKTKTMIKELQTKTLEQEEAIQILKNELKVQEEALKKTNLDSQRNTQLITQIRTQFEKYRQNANTAKSTPQHTRRGPAQRTSASLPSIRQAKNHSEAQVAELKNKRAMEEKRTHSMVQSLINQRSIADIVKLFNDRKMNHPDGSSWTEAKLVQYIKQHNIRRTRAPQRPAPAPKTNQ
ncbi:MAG: hypothetical protein HQL32_11240 [Planctomycetes bacterium]|nr:hypothetical protein [Planctomycetota bacterium]